VLALECWNGNLVSAQSFVTVTGVTFPLLRDAGFVSTTLYDIDYDNYVVVDPQGIVRYTSVKEIFGQQGRFSDTNIRATIDAYLPLAVQGATWAAVKQLFR
jgi:hypothetical protein